MVYKKRNHEEKTSPRNVNADDRDSSKNNQVNNASTGHSQHKKTENQRPMPLQERLDNSPRAKKARALQEMAHNSSRAKKARALQEMAHNSLRAKKARALQEKAHNSLRAKKARALQEMAHNS